MQATSRIVEKERSCDRVIKVLKKTKITMDQYFFTKIHSAWTMFCSHTIFPLLYEGIDFSISGFLGEAKIEVAES